MAETATAFLTAWSNFYLMIGTSAATLTGLMFVVITLMTRQERPEDSQAAVSAFSTPTVMHFAAVLLISAVLIVPWRSLLHAGAAVALIGLSGVVYIFHVMRRTRRLTMYTADVEDWMWFTILPFVAYGSISGGAIGLAAARGQWAFILAGGVVLLIFVGIRNAWDVVTYLAIVYRPPGNGGR